MTDEITVPPLTARPWRRDHAPRRPSVRILIRMIPVFIISIIMLVACAISAFNGDSAFFTGLFAFLVFASALIYWLGALLVALLLRRWRSAGHRAASIVALVTLGLPLFGMGDLIRLAIEYPTYAGEIRVSGGQKVLNWDWGDAARWVTDGSLGENLVFDPDDKEAQFVDVFRPGSDGGVVTRHLAGHFYLETDCSQCGP